MTGCDTSGNQFVSMNLVKAHDCTTSGTRFDDTVELILPRGQEITNITSQLRVKTFGAWSLSVDTHEAPRADDPCGVFRRMHFGCDRVHGPWTAEAYKPRAVVPATDEQADRYDLSLLAGAEGQFRRTESDGSYWEGYGKIIAIDALSEGGATDDAMTTFAVQYRGGKVDDPFYVRPTA